MSSAGLPSYLFDTYAFYKKSTSAFIQWLSLHSGRAEARAHINSTRDLIYMTEVCVKKRIKVPIDILQTLRRTIRARTRVGKFFKKLAPSEDNGGATSHEFFTGVLQQVYTDLRKVTEEAQATVSASEPEQFKLNNAFGHLHTEDCPEDCTEDEDQISCEKCEKRAKRVARKKRLKVAVNIGNDYVNEFMALSTYLLVSKHLIP